MVGRDEAGALGDGHEGADVIEEIDEEKDEDDLESADVERAEDVEVECRGFDCGEIVGCGLPVHLMKENAHEHGCEDADEHGGSDAQDLQDCDE